MASRKTANGRISAILDGEAWFTSLERPFLRTEFQRPLLQFFLLSARLLNPQHLQRTIMAACIRNGLTRRDFMVKFGIGQALNALKINDC